MAFAWSLETLVVLALVATWVSTQKSAPPVNTPIQLKAIAPQCNCVCGRAGALRTKRMAGGQQVFSGRYPWLATIFTGNDSKVVTGALISSKHVLTAMSPIVSIQSVDLKVGLGIANRCSSTATGLNMSVTSINTCPQFDIATSAGDLAVLTLSSPVVFSQNVRPVCLPPYSTSSYQYQVASVVSWGSNGSANSTAPCSAHEIQQAVLPPSTCRTSDVAEFFTSDKGCLGTQGTPSLLCSADGGGLVQVQRPGLQYYQLIGILPSTNNCSTIAPSLFTRVMPYLIWILNASADSCYCRA